MERRIQRKHITCIAEAGRGGTWVRQRRLHRECGDEEGCAYLDAAAEELLSYDCTYYTCHCTGLVQYGYLKARMGDRLSYLAGGDVLNL